MKDGKPDRWKLSLTPKQKELHQKVFGSKVLYAGRIKTCPVCGKGFYSSRERCEHLLEKHNIRSLTP